MAIRKGSSFLLAMLIGLAAVLVALGLMEKSRVLVQAGTATEPVRWDLPAQPPPPPPPDDSDLQFIAFFSDDLTIQVLDLSGAIVGEGTHGGEVRCNNNHCSQKTQMSFTSGPILTWTVEYRFSTRQALDPVEERAIVAGTGTLVSRGPKERFSFIATFQNNRDGTVSVRYEASRPDASFIIENAPGRFSIRTRPGTTVLGSARR
jgi:hypothetical protein